MKKLIFAILLLIQASCSGGGGGATNPQTAQATPIPIVAQPLVFGIRGKITGISESTNVLLRCRSELSTPPSQNGCYVQGSGYVMDAIATTDASGNYSFVDVIGTDHREVSIPIPGGFMWTVAPYSCADSTAISRTHSCAPSSYTFGLYDNPYGGVSGVDFVMAAIK